MIAPRRLQVGDVIAFEITYPGRARERVCGRVRSACRAGDPYPFNPEVDAPFGTVSVLNAEVGKSITILAERVTFEAWLSEWASVEPVGEKIPAPTPETSGWSAERCARWAEDQAILDADPRTAGGAPRPARLVERVLREARERSR